MHTIKRHFQPHHDALQTLAASLSAVSDPNDPFVSKLMSIFATRCMPQAMYFASGEAPSTQQFLHFGLASAIYTHFTSPIRRYADCVVHRLLAAALGKLCMQGPQLCVTTRLSSHGTSCCTTVSSHAVVRRHRGFAR